MSKYHYDSQDLFRERVGEVKPSPPVLDIYLVHEHGNNRGVTQTVFNWMRSGEWLTALMARELWGIYTPNLHYVIRTLRARGWQIECQVDQYLGKKRKFAKYRLRTWEPQIGGTNENRLQIRPREAGLPAGE